MLKNPQVARSLQRALLPLLQDPFRRRTLQSVLRTDSALIFDRFGQNSILGDGQESPDHRFLWESIHNFEASSVSELTWALIRWYTVGCLLPGVVLEGVAGPAQSASPCVRRARWHSPCTRSGARPQPHPPQPIPDTTQANVSHFPSLVTNSFYSVDFLCS